jgi:hypothetical protein
VASLASVIEHGGTVYVLCFGDAGPETGPHPISQQALRAAFDPGNGWNVVAIEPERPETRFHATAPTRAARRGSVPFPVGNGLAAQPRI